MRSRPSRFFYDHLFVKEPRTRETTPWHHDQPYWPVRGEQVCSIWLSLDSVTKQTSGLEYIKGSHRWPSRYRPEVWGNGTETWRKLGLLDSQEQAIPDIDAQREKYEFLSWDVEPGDCLVHHSLAIHGSSGNASATQRRRALATRAEHRPAARELARNLERVSLQDASKLNTLDLAQYAKIIVSTKALDAILARVNGGKN